MVDSLAQKKKLIRRWDSEGELFYDDILYILQSTIDSHINSGTDNDIATKCLL